MPEINLEPKDYRSDRRRVISRRAAGWQLVLCLVAALVGWWLAQNSSYWWADFITWPPLLAAGALITRLWPLFFLEDD